MGEQEKKETVDEQAQAPTAPIEAVEAGSEGQDEAAKQEKPDLGWCVVAKGLVEGGTERVIVGMDYADKEGAERGLEDWKEAENPPESASAKVMRVPKKCVVAKKEQTGEGTIVLADERETLDIADALAAVRGDRSLCMIYPSWTAGKKAALGVGVALAAACLVGGIALATAQPPASAPVAPKATASQSAPVRAEEKAEKSEVVLTVKAEGADAGVTKAKVVAADAAGKTVIEEREVEANKAVEVGELDQGDYELYVTAAPVCEDGSTYELPKEPVKFSVDGEGEPVEVECALSKIAKEDMSKEQLEAAADILEGAGKADAASAARASAQAAPSKPGSAASVQQSAPSAPSGGSSSSQGSAPAPAQLQHPHLRQRRSHLRQRRSHLRQRRSHH
ncbi:hypothetical protein [Arabiibacter massiliensis]|uniref:hypothetical protein n=1 Tax=Arabiibacter massiliensis TaxID=1870985 RepID=UPI0009B9BB50|nr:hypothetical protein [Arabiibacter massiliensis]